MPGSIRPAGAFIFNGGVRVQPLPLIGHHSVLVVKEARVQSLLVVSITIMHRGP